MRTLVTLLAALSFLACADDVGIRDDDPLGAEAAVASLDDKADAPNSGELRVRTGSLTVWLKVRGRTDLENGLTRVVVEGRASRDLVDARSWIPDDAFGEVVMKTQRKFEVVFDEAHEVHTVLSGAPVYLILQSRTGTPRDYHLRFAVEPRLSDFKGSRDVYMRDAVKPVFVRDGVTNLRYRGLATVTGTATGFDVGAGDGADPVVSRVDNTHFEFDWTGADLVLAMTANTDPVFFTARFGDRLETKTARLSPMVATLAITTGDPYEDFEIAPTCTESARACVAATEGDDLGACGPYRVVRACVQEASF